MHIKQRRDGDVKELRRMARRERGAEQRDRLLATAHAIEGMPTKDIQRALQRSRGFVQRWAYAYRDGGIEALHAMPRGGSEPRLAEERLPRLRERLEAGALPFDGVVALRGRNVQEILASEFDVKVSMSTVYRTLERAGFSYLARIIHDVSRLRARSGGCARSSVRSRPDALARRVHRRGKPGCQGPGRDDGGSTAIRRGATGPLAVGIARRARHIMNDPG